uniref:Nonsense-mediated mRNA decay factor SMG8 n=1 Tax=Macrostomum lignano TaxID=282301 RepID=A0A1I8IID3_9PLAT
MLTAADFDNIRALLYLFSVSHVVVFNCIGTQVNPAVTRTLQLVSQLRQQLLGQLCQAYRSFPVPRDWTLNGRTSCPAVLFHFQLSPGNLTKQLIDGDIPPRKTHHGPEAGNLCRLPDGGFCCVSPPAPASPSGVFQSLLELDDPVDLTDDQLLDNEFMQSLTGGSYNREFARFLERHMNQAEAEGGVGGGPLDLVSAKSWFKVCHKLHKLLLTDLDPGVQRVMNEFKARCDIVRKFSETRCASALPLAESVYREGLPAHYSHRVHTERIRKAQQVFLDNARGPAADKYLAELEARCNSVWLSGRQMCEALSVTSHPCVNERHSLPGTSADQQQQLPAMPHSLHIDAGRLLVRPTVGKPTRSFQLEEANVHFYSRLIDSCCGQHQPVPLPVYQRRGSEDKTQPQYTEELSNSGDLLPPLRSPELDDVELDQPSATLPSRTPLALAVEHSNYDEDEQLLLEEEADLKRKQRQCLKLESPKETGLSASNNTEVNDDEDLIGRYLPLVQSWCLLSVGRYNSYSHANGIGQPGFSSGSNHLLPWNVPVASKLWQQQQQQQQQSSQYRSTRREPTAKAWFGFEHECPFGHRFFVSSPGQMMRGAMQATQVKEGVQRLLSEDLPLFI